MVLSVRSRASASWISSTVFERPRSREVGRTRHLHHRGVAGLTGRDHLRVREATDIVHHVEVRVERGRGDLVIAGLDREHCVAFDPVEDFERGVEALAFLLGREHLETLVRGFEAYVDDVRTFLDEAIDVAGGFVGIGEDARIVRRLVADVEHTHDPRGVVVADRESGGLDGLHGFARGVEHIAGPVGRARMALAIGALVVVAATFAGVLFGRVLLSLLSRYREVAVDRGTVAITGSPANLASALSTLDETSVSLPSEDVRSSASVAAFSIVLFEVETDDGPVMLGPEGDRTPHLYNATKPIRKFVARVLRTHPDTSERVERLKTLQRALP